MKKILIAPNAFKGSVSAPAAANAIINGLKKILPDTELMAVPVADGGDGTAELLVQYLHGQIKSFKVHDPLGREIFAPIGFTADQKTAIISLADASGLSLLRPAEQNPLVTSTFGTGELILKAMDFGIDKVILTIGGSATVDGGIGILQALGIGFLDREEKLIQQLPADMDFIASFNLKTVDPRLSRIKLVILCDVQNPILGSEGAARVFGIQKGATNRTIPRLEARLKNLCHVIQMTTGKNIESIRGGGAAGGVAATLNALLDAELVNGADFFLDLLEFDSLLKNADLVITGEGRMDEQTLYGKAPIAVAKRAKNLNIPVIGIAGEVRNALKSDLDRYFDYLIAINSPQQTLSENISRTSAHLEQAATVLAKRMVKGEIIAR